MNTWVDWGEILDLTQWALGSTVSLLTNSFQLVRIVVSIVLAITVCVFVALVILRKKNPHSGKLDRTQIQVSKKINSGGKLSPDAVKTEANGKKLLDHAKELGLNAKVFWSLAAIITGIALWYAVPNTEVHPKDIGNWSRNHWLQILIVWGMGATLVWLNADDKSAKTLQKALAGGVIMLLAVFPVWSWIVSPLSTSQNVPRSETTLAKMLPRDTPDLPRAWNKDGTFTDTLKWPRVEVPPEGDSAHVPGILDGHVVWVWNDRGLTIRCVHDDKDRSIGIVGDESKPCHKDGVVESYMHNEGSTAAEASYAYASRFEK